MRIVRTLTAGWTLGLLVGCASAPPPAPASTVPAGRSFAGSFGGNAFTDGSVTGPGVQLARANGEWSGKAPCRTQQGKPVGACPVFITALAPGTLPTGAGNFDSTQPQSYAISRKGTAVVLAGQVVSYEFQPKVEREFPADLVLPLFWAIISSKDPAKELRSSDPPVVPPAVPGPATVLTWQIDVAGFGPVEIVRRPAS